MKQLYTADHISELSKNQGTALNGLTPYNIRPGYLTPFWPGLTIDFINGVSIDKQSCMYFYDGPTSAITGGNFVQLGCQAIQNTEIDDDMLLTVKGSWQTLPSFPVFPVIWRMRRGLISPTGGNSWTKQGNIDTKGVPEQLNVRITFGANVNATATKMADLECTIPKHISSSNGGDGVIEDKILVSNHTYRETGTNVDYKPIFVLQLLLYANINISAQNLKNNAAHLEMRLHRENPRIFNGDIS